MNVSTTEKLRGMIEQEILTFKLKPGERLDEMRLATHYGTSRTPVREALRQLATAGLVDIRPHRGAVVAQLGVSELAEMFEVMALLEAACARYAAERCTPDCIEAIRVAHENCRGWAEAHPHDEYYDYNATFHESIYRASHNSFLISQTMTLRNRLSAYRRHQLRRVNRPRESFREHEQIFRAIANGDANSAEHLMRNHISIQRDNITSIIASVPISQITESARACAAADSGGCHGWGEE
jgi:DNA-binding GntR family transcriptional regulator